jgi:hypothetical protein
MIWDDTYYYKFEQAQSYLKEKLGLIQLDYWKERPVLRPYYYYIVSFLNMKISNLGTDDLKTIVEEVFKTFEWGGDMIIAEETYQIAMEGGITDNEGEPVEYKQEYFVFSWADVMSTLCLRLKFQYAYLFAQEPDGECCVCNPRGQTETDYESWESGVYPEDECYDRTNYSRSNTAWGLNKDRFCECYKHEVTD